MVSTQQSWRVPLFLPIDIQLVAECVDCGRLENDQVHLILHQGLLRSIHCRSDPWVVSYITRTSLETRLALDLILPTGRAAIDCGNRIPCRLRSHGKPGLLEGL
jgi:hypothetical protein